MDARKKRRCDVNDPHQKRCKERGSTVMKVIHGRKLAPIKRGEHQGRTRREPSDSKEDVPNPGKVNATKKRPIHYQQETNARRRGTSLARITKAARRYVDHCKKKEGALSNAIARKDTSLLTNPWESRPGKNEVTGSSEKGRKKGDSLPGKDCR